MAQLAFTFDQIKLSKNENLNNSVLNRPLARLYSMINDLAAGTDLGLPQDPHSELSFLASVKTDKSLQPILEWHTASSIANELPKPALTSLSDVTKTLPTTGWTLVWNEAIKKWDYQKLPTKINDLNGFAVSDNPIDNSVITWNSDQQSWVSQTITKYIGVGYIYHKVCTRPTVVILPSSVAALSGGEQVVITKLRKAGDDTKNPVLVMVPNIISSEQKTSSIFGYTAILTNNHSEDFASIHLRSTIDSDGNFMWVPVAAMGTWKPTNGIGENGIDLNNLEGTVEGWKTGGVPTDIPPALTENQVKLQPYNIDLSLNINGKDISKEFDVVLKREDEEHDWYLDVSSDNSNVNGQSLYFSPITNVITVNHNVMDGFRLVRTDVFFRDGNKLCHITPNEIYFEEGLSSNYGAVNIEISDWIKKATTSDRELHFKVLVSI